jgi:hypothetical protein
MVSWWFLLNGVCVAMAMAAKSWLALAAGQP